jgi:hypothetical protein
MRIGVPDGHEHPFPGGVNPQANRERQRRLQGLRDNHGISYQLRDEEFRDVAQLIQAPFREHGTDMAPRGTGSRQERAEFEVAGKQQRFRRSLPLALLSVRCMTGVTSSTQGERGSGRKSSSA